jgi:hypothetical protein
MRSFHSLRTAVGEMMGPVQSCRAGVRMAVVVAAQPVRWLSKDQLALGKIPGLPVQRPFGTSLLVTGDSARTGFCDEGYD